MSQIDHILKQDPADIVKHSMGWIEKAIKKAGAEQSISNDYVFILGKDLWNLYSIKKVKSTNNVQDMIDELKGFAKARLPENDYNRIYCASHDNRRPIDKRGEYC